MSARDAQQRALIEAEEDPMLITAPADCFVVNDTIREYSRYPTTVTNLEYSTCWGNGGGDTVMTSKP